MPLDRVGGFPTHHVTFGTGPRPALMIHCSLAHSGAWTGLAAHLGDRLTMTAFDLPGHGRSGDWTGQGDIHDVSTDIARAFLATEGQTDLIGHSFGATVALRLAQEQPERVRSLILIEPVLFAVALKDTPEKAATGKAQLERFAAAMAAQDHETAARAFTRLWGDGRPWDSLPEAQRDSIVSRIHLITAADKALYSDSAGLLAPGRMERVTMPTLLVEGGDSPEIISAIQDGIERRLPDTRRVVIPGAAHMAPITHPDAVAEKVLSLLDETA